jgi:hypothetical protein
MKPADHINNVVWEKETTHNAKKKRSPRKTDPRALKRAKDARATSNTTVQGVYAVEITSMTQAMFKYVNSNRGGGSWVGDSFMAAAGIASMTTKWTVAQSNQSYGGYYVVVVNDAHKFLHACIKWGMDLMQQQTA